MYRVLLKTVLLVLLYNIKPVYSGSLRSNVGKEDNLQQNLDADEKIVFLLAESVCYDLEFYHNIYKKFIPFLEDDCRNNFMKSIKNTDRIPPKPIIRRIHQSSVHYYISSIDNPDVWRLIVLTPINASDKNYQFQLPYDLLMNNRTQLSIVDITTGEYQTWTTLIAIDGNHSPWLKGPVVHHTGANESYTLQLDAKHQVANESLTVNAISGDRGTIENSLNNSKKEDKSDSAQLKTEHQLLNESSAVKGVPETTGPIVYSSNYTEEENKTYTAQGKTENPKVLKQSLAVKAEPGLREPTDGIEEENKTFTILTEHQIVNESFADKAYGSKEPNGNSLNTEKENKTHTTQVKTEHQVVNESLVTWLRELDEEYNTYTINVKTEHQVVNGSSAAKALISWETFSEDDDFIDLRNNCGNVSTEIKLRPKDNTSWEVSGLPLAEDCEVQLISKHRTTRHPYRTLDCGDYRACIYYEKAHNVSLNAVLGAHGWDVFVDWSYLHQPLFFNVTILYDNVTRNMLLPGNVTEAVFENVEGSGFYAVAIVAVLETRTVHTSNRSMFPIVVSGWRQVTQALGGAWGALVCAGAAGAAAALLWRRRRVNHLKHIYFPETSDKLCKETGDAAVAEVVTIEDPGRELRSEKLLLHEVIGEGAFGVVRRGTLGTAGKEVAVKMLKDFPTLDEVRSFRAEIELMKSVGAHPHVVSLVGCCNGRKPFIVAEYCSRGDLLSYLRRSWDVMVSKRNAKYYNNNIESTDYQNDLFKYQLQEEHTKLVVNQLYDLENIYDTELTTRDLLSFCRQIAMGMEFLASNRLVHRDLAARNVLVSSDRMLKIADFGLSRDVYEENLYKQKGNGKMPMKWMAIESLTKRIYTSQSDVWSFGVVMWEVVSVGASPYPGVPPARLPRLLRAGYRMPRPTNCSKQLYEVMLSCWRAHPRERPTFAQLHARLDELLNCASAHDYLSLQPDLDDAPPHLKAHKYVKIYLKNKLGWSREESYERPVRTAQSNHYSTPPASAYKLQPAAS